MTLMVKLMITTFITYEIKDLFYKMSKNHENAHHHFSELLHLQIGCSVRLKVQNPELKKFIVI